MIRKEDDTQMAHCIKCRTPTLQQDLDGIGQCRSYNVCARLRHALDAVNQSQANKYAEIGLTSEEVGNLMFLCGYAIAKAQTDKQMPEGAAYRMARFVESLRRGLHGLGDDE